MPAKLSQHCIGANNTDGHLRHWQTKLEQYNITTPVDGDKITKDKVWNNNFKVPDFETTRNDAHDTFNQFVCYTDGSKLNKQVCSLNRPAGLKIL
jgi:hypothetical protein